MEALILDETNLEMHKVYTGWKIWVVTTYGSKDMFIISKQTRRTDKFCRELSEALAKLGINGSPEALKEILEPAEFRIYPERVEIHNRDDFVFDVRNKYFSGGGFVSEYKNLNIPFCIGLVEK